MMLEVDPSKIILYLNYTYNNHLMLECTQILGFKYMGCDSGAL